MSEISRMVEIKIINCSLEDAILQKHLSQIRLFLHDLTCNYPFFEEWLERVFSSIKLGERIIVACENAENIIGVAILKDTPYEKKICTIRVADGFRRQGIGTMLMIKSRELLKDNYPLITVSDEHIDGFRHFLSKFNFKEKCKVKSVYRYAHDEYYFNKPYLHQCVLISIRPQYARRIMSGEKTVEFRKVCFSNPNSKVYVYSSSPVRKILGYFEVEKIVKADPKSLWHQFAAVGYVDTKDFQKYYEGKQQGYAICIKRFVNFRQAIDINDVFDEKFNIHPPQNYMYIDNVVIQRRLRLLE